MILGFADRTTELLFAEGKAKRIAADIAARAKKQLDRLHAAGRVEDLYFPPSNRFERLGGLSPPRYSIRVNDQYRITFRWTGSDADEVRFEDYH